MHVKSLGTLEFSQETSSFLVYRTLPMWDCLLTMIISQNRLCTNTKLVKMGGGLDEANPKSK